MRRQAKREKRLTQEQDTIAAQRAEREEIESMTSRKKLEASALRALTERDAASREEKHPPRRARPGKPAQR